MSRRERFPWASCLRCGEAFAGSARERRHTRTANAMALGFAATTAPFIALFELGGHRVGAIVVFLVCCIYLTGPLLNARGHLLAARSTPLLGVMAATYSLASLFGPELQVQMALLMVTVWAFNLFDARRHRVVLLLLTIGPGALFALIEFGILLPVPHFPLSPVVAHVLPIGMIIGGYGWFVGVLFYFYRVNQGSEDQLAAAVARLEDENRARLAALREAEVARARAEKADASKTRFLAAMSHELRTPLHGVLGSLDLLVHEGRLGEDQRGLAQVARQGSRYLLALLHNVIDFASLDTGSLRLSSHRFSLADVLHDALSAVRNELSERPIALRAEIAEHVPTCARGDETRLRQVLANLLSNAVKFTREGHIAVRVDAQALTDGGLRLQVEVEDTGVGVPAELQEVIFERFVQTDAGLDRSYEGVGLGLSICHAVVTAMGGHIRARPRSEGGSVFSFSVQLEQAETDVRPEGGGEVREHAAPEPPGSAPVLEPGSGGSQRPLAPAFLTSGNAPRPVSVLIAEDNRVNQMIIKSMVKKLGFRRFELAENGRQAVDAFRAGGFDLVLMDIQMPVMDGIAAAREMRVIEGGSDRTRTPIVAISANVLADHVELGLQSGFDLYLAKPIELETLRAELGKVLSLPGPESTASERGHQVG